MVNTDRNMWTIFLHVTVIKREKKYRRNETDAAEHSEDEPEEAAG